MSCYRDAHTLILFNQSHLRGDYTVGIWTGWSFCRFSEHVGHNVLVEFRYWQQGLNAHSGTHKTCSGLLYSTPHSVRATEVKNETAY